MPVRHHDRATPGGAGAHGRTRWRRFFGLLAPTGVVAGLMIAGVLQGTLPVSAAMQGQQRIKLAVENISANGYGTYPQLFRTRDGHTRPLVAVGLQQVRAHGVCASGKVDTPLGPYVLRMTTKPGTTLRVEDLQMAIEEVNGAEASGQSLSLNRSATTPDGIPTESGPPGTLPIDVKTLNLGLHANLRWVTASGLNLTGVDLTTALGGKECF